MCDTPTFYMPIHTHSKQIVGKDGKENEVKSEEEHAHNVWCFGKPIPHDANSLWSLIYSFYCARARVCVVKLFLLFDKTTKQKKIQSIYRTFILLY